MPGNVENMNGRTNITYILKCKDGTYYTGWTNDMKKRFQAHLSGRGGKYTRSHPPECIAYMEAFETKEEAMRREYEIKHMTRKEKEALILAQPLTKKCPPDAADLP